MRTLHQGLKGEIEYCLGMYGDSKSTFAGLKEEIARNSEDFEGKEQQEFVERVDWFLEQLDGKAT